MPLSIDDVKERLNRGDYYSKLPMFSKREDPERFREFVADTKKLEAQFRTDALEAVGLAKHPKAAAIINKAWDYGYDHGLHGVLKELQGLAKLF